MRPPTALCLLTTLLLCVSFCPAATLNVPADYPTVQAAVDASLEGDTVLIAAGTYTGNVTIATSGLTVQGAGKAQTVIKDGSNSGFSQLLNIAANNTGAQVWQDIGWETDKASRACLILAGASANKTFRRCAFTQGSAATFEVVRSTGASGSPCTNWLMDDCEFYGSAAATRSISRPKRQRHAPSRSITTGRRRPSRC